jgi:energy-coupling factor transport system substrate-specific component
MRNSALISKLIVSLAAATSLIMFLWPLLIASPRATDAQVAQTTFLLLMPLVLLIAIVELTTKGIDSRQLAVLAVLIALNALIRMFGAGTAGIETAFFLIIIAAYVFGSQFGFILGAGSIFVSSLITAGVGPWLPFQMMAAALIGFAAGVLPRPKALKIKIIVLVLYAIVASFLYGWLMTIWNWPYLIGLQSEISYVAGAGFFENLRTFFAYDLMTGGLLWDLGRAVTTSLLIVVTAPALLTTLNRAANRAGFSKN